MRKVLATAVAMGPLCMALAVHAETKITKSTTTAVATATANSGAPDDLTITSDGSVAVTSGAAVTLNSNNDVSNAGSITMKKADDGSTGILVQGGETGDVTNTGSITITSDVETKDDDNDGDDDGPFANGSNKAGVRVTGTSPLIGSITNSGTISVNGNDSYGILVTPGLTGSLKSTGTISVTGDGSYGVRVQGPVGGDVALASVSAVGKGSVGISIEGDVAGALTLDNSVTATGYRYTSRPTLQSTRDKLDADDLLQGGSAVQIGANIAKGVLLSAPPTDTDPDNADEDGDGVADASQTTASVISYGSAPAIKIGSTTQTVTLGEVGTGDNAYGLINKGIISGLGVYDGATATAVQIGVAGGKAVTVTGGFLNTGTITGLSYQADATGVRVTGNASVPTLSNSGTITASSTSDIASTSTAIAIDADGHIDSLVNSGTIKAGVTGLTGNAVAVSDASGTLSNIVNTGKITASVIVDSNSSGASQADVTGTSTALDLSHNTTGVTLVQKGVASTDSGTDTDGDGVDDTAEPAITGNIKLGSGADTLDIENGTVTGDIAFGAGADTLSISGGAAVTGAITDSDGRLSIDIGKGSLVATNATPLTATSLNVGSTGSLILTVNPSATQPALTVTGGATLASGAGLGVRFADLLQGPERYTLVSAGSLTTGALDTSVTSTPYIFVSTLTADDAAGKIYVDAHRRTADEAGMIRSEAQAYDGVYAALTQDTDIKDAFLSATSKSDFYKLYRQMLPDHSGGTLLSLAAGVDAVSRALADRRASTAPGQTTAWAEEINFYAHKDQDEAEGFKTQGFGMASGVERGTGLGDFGVSAAFTSSNLKDLASEGDENLDSQLFELGVYWRAAGQHWRTWARAAGGYAWFDSRRDLVTTDFVRKAKAEWDGWSGGGGLGGSYQWTHGSYYLRPEVSMNYLYLKESSRQEKGAAQSDGSDGFDLAIDGRSGHLFTTTALVAIGARYGKEGWWSPEFRVGWKQNVTSNLGKTTAQFASGDPFTLASDDIDGGGPTVGFRLTAGDALGYVALQGDASWIDGYDEYTLSFRAGFFF